MLLGPDGPLELDLDAVIVIGRDTSCDIVLDHPLVSLRHARIIVLRTGVLLEDTASTNGVYLNGIRVQRASLLNAGDRVVIGTTEFSLFA